MKLPAIRKAYFLTLAISLIFGGVSGFLIAQEKISVVQFLGGFFGMLMLGIIVAIPVGIQWWRQIDEASREAHKTAWFWGGSFGLYITTFIACLNLVFGISFIDFLSKEMNAPELLKYGFEVGVLLTLAFAGIGYSIHWALWWRKMGA